MADHAGVGAVRDQRGRIRDPRPAKRARCFAQPVVRSLGRRKGGVSVAARPGLDAGVDVQRAHLAAQRNQRDRGDFNREVDAEPAAREQRRKLAAKVVTGQGEAPEAYALAFGEVARRIICVDHHHSLAWCVDVAEDERQGAFADRTEADHHDRAGEAGMDGTFAHSGILRDTDARRRPSAVGRGLGRPFRGSRPAAETASPR